MILCLVTDRRRLGAAVGVGPQDWLDALAAQVAAAAVAGVDLIQVREPDLEAAEQAGLIRSLLAACAGTPAKILVNDRLDVALATGTHGVHLREASFGPDVARKMAPPGFVVGCAVHAAVTATARRSADFLIAGTVLPTVSKPAADYLEWEGLKRVVAAAQGTPVLGIGGLDVPSMSLLAASGAAGLAAIGAFIPTAGRGVAEFVQKRVAELRFGFDSAQQDP